MEGRDREKILREVIGSTNDIRVEEELAGSVDGLGQLA